MTLQSDREELCLVEDYSDFCADFLGNVLALTPEAAYEFSLNERKHFIFEDFYSEAELESLSPKYLDQQLAWFKDLNQYIHQKVPSCLDKELDLLLHLRFRVKYFCDSVFFLAYIFHKAFSQLNPSQIIYIKNELPNTEQSNLSIAHLNDNSRRFMFLVCKAVCESMGISVELKTKSSEPRDYPIKKNASLEPSFFKRVAKSAYYLLRYPRNPFHQLNAASALFLTAGHKDLDAAFSHFLKSGRPTYLRQGKKIINVSNFFHREEMDVAKESSSRANELRSDFLKAAQDLELRHSYFDFMKTQCCVDLEGLCKPYIQDFIQHQCLETVSEVPVFKEWLEKNDVQLVLTNSSTNYADASIMMAAKSSKKTKRVCFQHGCHILKFPMWRLSQEPFFDVYFATDPETREYTSIEFKSNLAEGNCDVKEYAEFLRPQMPYAERQKIEGSKENIFYLPTRGPVGVRIMNAPAIPITWYAQFQRDLLDLLATQHKDKNIIFKYLEDDDWLSNSTLRHLKKMNYSNVKLESAPFSKCIESADRIIMDHPGTAFYEAAAAGLPVIALYLDHFQLRETAAKYFQNNLCPIKTFDDAKQHVERFLNAPAETYRVHLPLTDTSPMDFLLKQVNDGR